MKEVFSCSKKEKILPFSLAPQSERLSTGVQGAWSPSLGLCVCVFDDCASCFGVS